MNSRQVFMEQPILCLGRGNLPTDLSHGGKCLCTATAAAAPKSNKCFDMQMFIVALWQMFTHNNGLLTDNHWPFLVFFNFSSV